MTCRYPLEDVFDSADPPLPLQGKEPLLYVTVLLLSLQFQEALRFLWKDETTKMYRVDAVHLAIAMHQEQALAVSPGKKRARLVAERGSNSRSWILFGCPVRNQGV